jgi:hypothetical protein
MFGLLTEIFPKETELFFSIFLVVDMDFLFVASIKEYLMPQYPHQCLAKFIFGLQQLQFSTAFRNRFPILLHILNGIEFFNIISTVHEQIIKFLGKLYKTEIKAHRVKELPAIRCKNDRIENILNKRDGYLLRSVGRLFTV